MELIAKADGNLMKFAEYINKSKRRAFAVSVIIYAAVFLLFFSVSVLPVLMDTGTIMGGDGVSQYYPYLLDLRRNIISFAESIRNGSPQLTMMNFDYSYGADTITSTAMNFMPMLPYYALSAFISEVDVPLFFAVGAILLSFMAGLSFIVMCADLKQNMLWSGVIAPFYVFCGNYFFTGILNPQFLYMYIAFPLMIAGIDRILRQKSWIMLTLSVFWLALSGFSMLVYTLPFVVVFALIRVYFLYKGEFFKNLLKFFLRGCGAVLLGAALAAFVLLPCLGDYFSSSRLLGVSREVGVSLLELLIPSAEYMNDTLSGIDVNASTGICVVLMPCFLYILTSQRVRKDVRCCGITMLLLVALPLIRYGLNGFQYELCRWGFVPVLLICFCCVAYMPMLLRTDREERESYIFFLTVYVLLLTLQLNTIAGYFILLIAVLNSIPFTRRYLMLVSSMPRKLWDGLIKEFKKKEGHLYFGIAAIVGFAAIMAAFFVITSKSYAIYPLLLVSALSIVLIMLLFDKKGKNTAALLIATVYIVIGVFYNSAASVDAYIIGQNEIFDHIADMQLSDGDFGRYSAITNESKSVVDLSSEMLAEPTEENGIYGSDSHLNAALRYDIADISIFRSTLNGDLMSFLGRCGQDCLSLLSTGQINEFSGKEVLYSLFGTELLYSENAPCDRYGFELIENTTYSDGRTAYIYRNNYALPLGVTYSSVMERDRFEDLNSAELPYAMMDSVYLEGYEPTGDMVRPKRQYSDECEFTFSQVSRGKTSFGIECYDNQIQLTSDVSGKFLYLSFEGVKSSTYESAQNEAFSIFIDDKYELADRIHNQNTTWEWGYYTDHYTFALGFCNEDVNSISFVSPFEFDSVKVYAVPEEVYTSAYSDRCEAILENVEIATNELTGKITVSADRILSLNMLYSDGWTAYIDGGKAPIYKANGLFLGIPINEGAHSVRLVYRSPWLYEGAVVSCAAVVVFILLILYTKKRTKTN